MSASASSQKGAALIIVLLLVATLSVIAVGLSDQTLLAAARARNEHARAQMFWRANGAEILATQMLGQAISQRTDNVMSLDDLWAIQPFELSALAVNENEQGEILFADATACFNLNSLWVREEDEPSSTELVLGDLEEGEPAPIPLNQQRVSEFATLLSVIGIGENDARQLAIVIRDWIDPDQVTGPGGAEDAIYLALPVPYRTGNSLLVDASELRAMIGVDRVLMAVIAPFVCARPTNEPSMININMLRPQDAPVLMAAFGGALSLRDAELIIERRPAGGYQSVNDMVTRPFLAGLTLDPVIVSERLAVRSNYLHGRMRLQFGKTFLQTTMLLSVGSDNRPTLVSRRIGS